MNAVEKIEPQAMQEHGSVVQLNPVTLIDRALATGASPEALEKLLALQERWEASQARKAFIQAMNLARAKFGPVLKMNKGYKDRYRYETLTDVMKAVDEPLGEHGFSYDWETEDVEGGRVRVTCVLTHEAGHVRRNSLAGDPKDTASPDANMNGFQRLGGAVTYLQRYTLKAALGIAADFDTDGGTAASEPKPIDDAQFRYLQDLIEKAEANEPKLLVFLKAEKLETLTQAQYKLAEAALRKKINAKAAEKKP